MRCPGRPKRYAYIGWRCCATDGMPGKTATHVRTHARVGAPAAVYKARETVSLAFVLRAAYSEGLRPFRQCLSRAFNEHFLLFVSYSTGCFVYHVYFVSLVLSIPVY